ncbi:MAG: hypothetical protein RIE86_15890, partial [Imperialibacter sp.]|uniref:hypothetical protein n=1 Tax=Imperialibacter sp. TaxID=2038411 RepID=UPI0032ED2088
FENENRLLYDVIHSRWVWLSLWLFHVYNICFSAATGSPVRWNSPSSFENENRLLYDVIHSRWVWLSLWLFHGVVLLFG